MTKPVARQIRIVVDDAEHDRLKDEKGDRTWLEMLQDGAEGQS